jgi:hypothetical protein
MIYNPTLEIGARRYLKKLKNNQQVPIIPVAGSSMGL